MLQNFVTEPLFLDVFADKEGFRSPKRTKVSSSKIEDRRITMVEIVTNLNLVQVREGYNIVATAPKKEVSPGNVVQRITSYGPTIDELFSATPGLNAELDKYMIMALMYKESVGNPRARNALPARGLAQFLDGTALEMGVIEPYNYADNLKGMVKFINSNMSYLKSRVPNKEFLKAYTIAAHLTGKGAAVSRYATGADSTTGITVRKYVAEIEKLYRQFGGSGFTLPA